MVLLIAVPDAATPDVMHRFRNFGEDVHRTLGEKCSVSIEEIDAAKTSFHLRDVRQREVRAITKAVRELLEQHNFTGTVTPK